MVGFLYLASILNMVYLFTRLRTYHMHKQPDPVASPNASFVPVEFDFAPPAAPTLSVRLRKGAWSLFVAAWRWLLDLSPSRTTTSGGGAAKRVQQLDVWAPGELELGLFTLYSPAHALLWTATTGQNWILTGLVMGLVGAQMQVLTRTYERLLKDRAIIAAEVMHEYDEKVRRPGCGLCVCVLIACSVCVSAGEPYPQGCGGHDTRVGDGERLGVGFARMTCFF
jgi:hypothetical protein